MMMGLPALAALGGLLLGATLGYGWEHRRAVAELAALQAAHAQNLAAAEQAARARTERALAAADAQTTAAQARLDTALATAQELRHALRAQTSGRACLDAGARRLLGRHPAFAPADLPVAAGRPARPLAPPATHPGELGSTDTDVALWITDAATLYEECRGRIDALRAWRDEVGRGHR